MKRKTKHAREKDKRGFRLDYPWKKQQVIIINGKEYLFLHVHKTGGTSIKKYLLNLGPKSVSHSRVKDIVKEIGYEKFKQYKTFAVVRNPYDRVVSAYYYMKKTDRMPSNISFSKFVLNKKERYSIYNEICCLPQSEYLCYKQKLECDVILKFENLEEEFKSFLKEASYTKGESREFPHLRKVDRKEWKKMFSNSKLIEAVNQYYSRDFELFGYEKIST